MIEDLSDNLVTTKTIDDEFKRTKQYINSCGFTEEQLIRRANDLKELVKLYPNMCISHLELAWNFCEMTPDEELTAIRLEKRYEGKPTTKRQVGGVIKNAISVEKGGNKQIC